VGEETSVKIDPILKKSLSRNELGIIVLFAAANGDLLTLKRSREGRCGLCFHKNGCTHVAPYLRH
jgi:hypothetical protein